MRTVTAVDIEPNFSNGGCSICPFHSSMANPAKCPARTISGRLGNTAIPTIECDAATLIRELIQKAIANERARAAVEEIEQYGMCFWPNARIGARARYDRIVRVASTRMLLAHLNLPSS